MRTSKEIIEELENTINPISHLGMNILTIASRLEYATKVAEGALNNLADVYKSIGNDAMLDLVLQQKEKLKSTLP